MSSSNSHRVLIIANGADGAVLERGLAAHAEVTRVEPNATLALSAARAQSPELCLVFVDDDPEALLELTRQLHTGAVSIPIVVSADKRPDNILRAMRAGARDFAHFDRNLEGPLGAATDALRALRGLSELAPSKATVRPRSCKVISVFGCKGGVGATTLAINLAHAIRTTEGEAGERPEVAVLDFDTMLGDVAVMLDLKHAYGFRDLLDDLGRLDAELLRSSLARHESGFYVLSGAGRADPMAEFAAADLERMLGLLAQHFDYIVIDGLRDFHEHALVALDRADSILCVMTQDLPSLKNASRALKLCEALGYPPNKLSLVLNRHGSAGKRISVEMIADALHHEVDATVHNDFGAVIKCVDAGELITQQDPSNKVAKDLRALAALYHKPAAEKRRSLFSLWSRT